MTDYVEEQQNELEALQSIYPEEFQEIGENEFSIAIFPDELDNDNPCSLALRVKYTPQYPDELPEFDIEVTNGRLLGDQKQQIMSALQTAAEESIGMVMVFTLASLAKEELNQILDDTLRQREAAEAERIRREEEIENARFRGTKVTWERFQEWKIKFDQEIAAKESEERAARAKELKGKLTGRQLFESDKTLAMSDSKYMDEGDVSVDTTQYERSAEQYQDEEDDDKDAVWKRFGTDD
ncbi:ubiquitin-conjugating enzyme/RWD-like protein [Dichotomocladium elegans]|nr:ubiquitin-conjugating enzyme/RWD-like protein [Dichotomocladium elegans]